MKVLARRGKSKGVSYTVHQHCNDWITVEEENKVLTLASVACTYADGCSLYRGQTFPEYELYQLPVPLFDTENFIYAWGFKRVKIK